MTRLETCWNVTKCHACHAKQHDSLFWNLQQRWVLQLPPYLDTATAAKKPATRDETCWSLSWGIKTSISCETSSNSSQVAASKSMCSYEFSYGPTSKSTFRARLPSIFITCHKMPRLPRNFHLVTTSRSADNGIRENTQHDTYKVLCACHRKWPRRSSKCCTCLEKCIPVRVRGWGLGPLIFYQKTVWVGVFYVFLLRKSQAAQICTLENQSAQPTFFWSKIQESLGAWSRKSMSLRKIWRKKRTQESISLRTSSWALVIFNH